MTAQLSSVMRALVRRFAEVPGDQPRVIAITGSVAVGKSALARALRRKLLRHVDSSVECVGTDGFLRPDAELEAEGLLPRKGFPESYDHAALADFFARVRAREATIAVPVYSHVLRGVAEQRHMATPRWLIVEGVYALQPAMASGLPCFSIFLDADPVAIRSWYSERFIRLYAPRFASVAAAEQRAQQLFEAVNYANYRAHIAPLRPCADLVVHKTAAHQPAWLSRRRLGTSEAFSGSP
jgi:type I pantothenate kinase